MFFFRANYGTAIGGRGGEVMKKMVCFRVRRVKVGIVAHFYQGGGGHCSSSISRGRVHYWICAAESGVGWSQKNVLRDNPNSVESQELLEV